MNKQYECYNNFLIRIPYKSLNYYYKNLFSSNEGLMELIKSTYNENLLANSFDLYTSINESDELNNAQKISLIKYLLRASTRTTPFGLNSGLLSGNFDYYINSEIGNEFYKIAKPDFEWLSKVVKKSEQILFDKLLVTKSNLFKVDGIDVEKKWNTFYTNDDLKERNTVHMSFTKALQKVLKLTEDYVQVDEICEKLLNDYPDMPMDQIKYFLKTLFENEILISNLRKPLIYSNQFEMLIKDIKNYNASHVYFDKLFQINKHIDLYNEKKVSEGRIDYSYIISKMSELEKAKNYLHIDMYNNSRITLNTKVKNDVEEFTSFISKWTFNEEYNEYIMQFKEKYGEQAVKFLDLIDSEKGLGAPRYDKKSSMEYNDALNRFFFSCAANSRGDVIDLSNIEFEDYNKGNYPNSGELSFYIFNRIDEGGYEYLVSPMIGSSEAGKSLGRFRYLKDKCGFEPGGLDDNQIQENDIEVTFLPESSHHSNVMGTVSDEMKFLEYGTVDKSGRAISLDNIYVFVLDDKLMFIEKNTKEIINFKASNKYRVDGYPKELRILLELSENQYPSLLSFQLCLQHLVQGINYHCPKIVYKNFILSPESWKLKSKVFINKKLCKRNEFNKIVELLIEKENIPKEVWCGPNDYRLILNLKDEHHLEILYRMYKEDPDLLIYENPFSIGNLIVKDKNDEYYIAEFVFQLSNMNTFKKTSNLLKLNAKIPTIEFKDNLDNSYFPFEKWISLKLYMNEHIQEFILTEEIKALINKFIKSDVIEKLFYIRYRDPKEHIRLRIKLNSSNWDESLIQIISSTLYNLKEKNFIKDCQIDSYFQEYERYGGVECIDAAEELFFKDSISCIELIDFIKSGLVTYNSTDLFIISAIRMMYDMEIKLEQQVKFLKGYNAGTRFNEDYRNRKQIYEKVIDHKKSWENLRSTAEGIRLAINFDERSRSFKEYWNCVISNYEHDEMRQKGIILSILHMHFNRLVGINRGLETKTMAILYKVLYNYQNKIMNYSRRVSE